MIRKPTNRPIAPIEQGCMKRTRNRRREEKQQTERGDASGVAPFCIKSLVLQGYHLTSTLWQTRPSDVWSTTTYTPGTRRPRVIRPSPETPLEEILTPAVSYTSARLTEPSESLRTRVPFSTVIPYEPQSTTATDVAVVSNIYGLPSEPAGSSVNVRVCTREDSIWLTSE